VNESSEVSERRRIAEVVQRLINRNPTLDPVTVVRVVREMHRRYDGRPVREYIPLFVERNAVAELNRLSARLDTRTAAPLGATG
jgi:hypothetical protein